jgi:hypothetical protein
MHTNGPTTRPGWLRRVGCLAILATIRGHPGGRCACGAKKQKKSKRTTTSPHAKRTP